MAPAPERRKEWGGGSKNTHKTVEVLETGWGRPGSKRTKWNREKWVHDGEDELGRSQDGRAIDKRMVTGREGLGRKERGPPELRAL